MSNPRRVKSPPFIRSYFMNIKDTKHFQEVCFEKAKEYFQEQSGQPFECEKISVVWYCKTLQNFKCLIFAYSNGKGLYFEFTFNGDKGELYMDVYTKIKNECIV